MYGNVTELDNYSQIFLLGAKKKYFHIPPIPEYQTTTLLSNKRNTSTQQHHDRTIPPINNLKHIGTIPERLSRSYYSGSPPHS